LVYISFCLSSNGCIVDEVQLKQWMAASYEYLISLCFWDHVVFPMVL
jgi:hypothetical protein